jgi:hypothetical protein
MYSASSVTAALPNPLLLFAGQQVIVPLILKNDTNIAVELSPSHAVMLQFCRRDNSAELTQGVAFSGLSRRSSSFTLVRSVTAAGVYSMKTAVTECGTLLLEYSHVSDAAIVTSQLQLTVLGPIVDTLVQNLIPQLHRPLNVSINAYLIVPNDRASLRVQAVFNQPFSLFVNSYKIWECRNIDCDSGELDLGQHNAGDVLFLRLSVARLKYSSRFSMFWNGGNHPVVMDPILSHHACSSPVSDITGGATLVSVTGASLDVASTRLQWHPSAVSQYCSLSTPNGYSTHLQPHSFWPDDIGSDYSACLPHIVAGTLISFTVLFQDSYRNFVSPDLSSFSVFLSSGESDMEASISSVGVETVTSGPLFSFSIRVIRSTFEQPASIRLRQLAQGLIATYYRDLTAFSTSSAPVIDWSANGNFPSDTSFQIWRVKWEGFLKSPSSGAWTLVVSKPTSSIDLVQIRVGRFNVQLGASSSWGNVFSFSQSLIFAISIQYTHFAGSLSSGLTLSWKHEGIPAFATIPSSAFFVEQWSFTSNLNVRVFSGASQTCQAVSPSVSFTTVGLATTFAVSATDAFDNEIIKLPHIELRLIQLSGCSTISESSCVQLAMPMDLNEVQVTLTQSGVYQLDIVDRARMDAACTSFPQIYAHPAPALLKNSLLSITSATIATAGTPLMFQLTSRDQFSNLTPLLASSAFFLFKLFCMGPSPCCDPCVSSLNTCGSSILCSQSKNSFILQDAGTLTSLGSHQFILSFIPTQSGVFRLQIFSSKECSYCDNLPAMFWDVTVLPSVHSAANLDATDSQLNIVAGDSITIFGRSFDMFGNVVLAPDPPSQINCILRMNNRVVSVLFSSLNLLSNFYIMCVMKVTKSGTSSITMSSFRSKLQNFAHQYLRI